MTLSTLLAKSAVLQGALFAFACAGCSSGPSDDSAGDPRPANVPTSTPGGPRAAVTSSSGTVDLARRIAEPDASLRGFLSVSADHAFRPEHESFVSPSWDETSVDRFRQVAVRLPARSVDTFTVGLGRIARFGLQLKLEGVKDVPATIQRGSVVYEGAFRATDLVWAATDDRVEELLVLRASDAPREFSWKVTLPSGLHDARRDRTGALMFLDRRGDGVLRVPPPYAVDARGTRRDAALSWNDGRLAVRLDTSGLEYPVLLDPAVQVVLWEKKTPATTTPPARHQSAMAYDSARGQVVLASGADRNGPLGETWGWDGSDWSVIDTTTTPAHPFMELAYDSVANKSLIFGGCSPDTWLLSGSTWSQAFPVDSPTSRHSVAMAYDGPPSAGGRGKVVLFGGHRCVIVEQNMGDTWEWNGTNWTELFPSPAPDARAFAILVYDSKRSESVMFGGSGDCPGCFFEETWTWDGTLWDKKTPSRSPSGRYGHKMAYDSATGRTVLFAGNNGPFLEDTWEWDGSTWTPMTPATHPPLRWFHAMAYDAARGRVVLFGGEGATGLLDDTWEYHSHGEACANGTECDTGHCVDGVCCEQTSCGQCEACDTVTSPGVCAKVINTQDDSCNGTMGCDGSSVCKVFQGQACPCPKGLFCVDGLCCGTACTGQCEACDVAASLGTCVAITGKPHAPSHPACTGDGTTCGGICGGTNRLACVYPNSTKSCRTAGCANGTVNAAAGCDGTGACPAPQTTSCDPYTCDSSGGPTCGSSCTGDSDCWSTAYCVAPTCIPKLTLGQGPCTEDRMCLSGHCADGVCCDTACNGQCEACNVGGLDGVCQAVSGVPVGGRTPCTGAGTTCGGTCNGTNQATCTYPATTVSCRLDSCANDVQTLAASCDGAGTCPLVTKDCAPLQCNVQTCKTDCTGDADCTAGFYCDLVTQGAGICRAQLDLGQNCATTNQCKSGHCVDTVCCDTNCNEQCAACDVAGSIGTCSPVNGAPHGARPACGGDGTNCNGRCDGTATAACSFPGAGTQCRAPICANDVATLAAVCDGTGACPAVSTQDCTPYTCGATQCNGDCVNTSCKTGSFCSGGVCKAKLANGSPCGAPDQCVSGFCVDSVCCDRACSGQCEACNVAATQGTCTTVTTAPVGGRSACPGSGTCAATCDGTNAASCTYPGSSQTCVPGSCSGGSATSASVCDGQGACGSKTTTPCGAYACVAGACKTTCAGPADCATGFWCSAGTCVPLPDAAAGMGGANQGGMTGNGGAAGASAGGRSGAAGSGAGAVMSSGGGGNAGTSADAGAGGPNGFTDIVKDDSGCGCRTAQARRFDSASLFYGLAGLLVLARRSRRRARVNAV